MTPTHVSPAGPAGAPHVRRRSAWPVVLAALCVSLPLHLWLAVWLSGIMTSRPERTQPAVLMEGPQGVGEQEPAAGRAAPAPPSSPPPAPMPVPTAAPEAAWQAPAVADGAIAATAASGATDLSRDTMATGAPGAAAIGGGGQGDVGAVGGVGSTTFFGARASGRRFAFIVDKSGSMATDGKLRRAMDELLRSVRALPDFTQFRVCMFDTGMRLFPEGGFARARPADLERLGAWLTGVGAAGGTTPMVAFQRMLADGAPDAIFFLTDGEIGAGDPAAIVQAVTSASGVVPVHCVAFGDERAAVQLQGIARSTGGDYRFVPLRGAP